MSLLALTDDEIVAIAASERAVWSAPLPSLDDTGLEIARLRGARSLIVRDLVNVRDGAAVFDAEALSLVTDAAASRTAVVAFVAGRRPGELAGSSTAVFAAKSGGAIIDLITPNGTHQFERSTTVDARKLVDALARNVMAFGIAHDDGSACLMMGRPNEPEWLRITQSHIERGVLHSNGEFDVASSTSQWSEDLVAPLWKEFS